MLKICVCHFFTKLHSFFTYEGGKSKKKFFLGLPNDHFQGRNSFPDQTRNEEKLVNLVFRLVDTGSCFSLKHMVIAVISYTPDTVICQCLSKMMSYALCRFHGILYIIIYKIPLFFEMKA